MLYDVIRSPGNLSSGASTRSAPKYEDTNPAKIFYETKTSSLALIIKGKIKRRNGGPPTRMTILMNFYRKSVSFGLIREEIRHGFSKGGKGGTKISPGCLSETQIFDSLLGTESNTTEGQKTFITS